MDHGTGHAGGNPLVDADMAVDNLFGGSGVTCGMAADAGFCGNAPIIDSMCPRSCGANSGAPTCKNRPSKQD